MAKKVAEDNEIILATSSVHYYPEARKTLVTETKECSATIFVLCLERMKNHAFKLDFSIMLITGEKSLKNKQIQNSYKIV